jgi:hypothetical protein
MARSAEIARAATGEHSVKDCRYKMRALADDRRAIDSSRQRAHLSQEAPVADLAAPSLPNPRLPARVAPVFLAAILCQRSIP